MSVVWVTGSGDVPVWVVTLPKPRHWSQVTEADRLSVSSS